MKYLLVFAMALAAASCSGHAVDLSKQAPATLKGEPPGGELARVVRIVDGDTIVVEVIERMEGPGLGGEAVAGEQRVRLIGIDTPESVRPGTPIECFGKEASAALKALLEDREIFMVVDVENVDRYDRLLRYVYLGEEMANARLIANGYAHAYTYPPNVRHSELFVQLERTARDNDRGLWAPDTCAGEVMAFPVKPPVAHAGVAGLLGPGGGYRL